MFNLLKKPATFFLNKLSYKRKLSLFFLIMLLPFLILVTLSFMDIKREHDIYHKKNITIKYNGAFTTLIVNLQKHRGFSGIYFNGDYSLKNEILDTELEIDKNFKSILNLDSRELNLYKRSPILVEFIKRWEGLKLDKTRDISKRDRVYNTHTKLIKDILDELSYINKRAGLKISDNITMYSIEDMLYSKLPILSEYVGQARGHISSKLTNRDHDSNSLRHTVFLYGIIKSNLDAISSDLAGIDKTDQEDLLLKSKEAKRVSNNFLKLINSEIINKKVLTYDKRAFFKEGTDVVQSIFELHNSLVGAYKKLLSSKIDQLNKKLLYQAILFLFIAFLLFYIFKTFYKSLMSALRKLQIASIRIAKGDNSVTIFSETEDEFSDVIRAFNIMSSDIRRNISFLNGYKLAIDESSIVSKSDKAGIITYANDKFCTLSGYSSKELLGKPHSIIRHPDMPKEIFKDMWETIKAKKVWRGIIKNRRKSGKHYFVDATVIPILDNNNRLIEYVAVRHDITELEDKKVQLQKQRIDLLTTLFNRSQMIEDLKSIKNPALFLLNINSFAQLNDFYGNRAGDEVLKEIGKILQKIADSVKVRAYRLHADEFAILNELKESSYDDYRKFVAKVIDIIEGDKISFGKNKISVTLTAGVAFMESVSKESSSLSSLLINANSALRDAKESNKKFLIYDSSRKEKINYEKNMQSIEMIKSAILDNRVISYYQPIVDNYTGKVSKYESLVRIVKEDGTIIVPSLFLDIAKKAKLYSDITKIVIENAFNEFRDREFDFSINLSIEDIQDKKIVEFIKESLSSFPDPKRAIFEIVESEEIKDYQEVARFIKDIKSFGAKIAIDDFGSGYSNFEHILTLDVDYLKIDGSLIKNIDKDEESRIITNAIIAFCKKLNRKTIVEFVHNEEIYNLSKSLGADYSQGFFLGRAVSKLDL